MVNLKAFPFMALGVSPISVDESSKRYLISAYLTGRDNVQYPVFGNRKAHGYTYAKDLHLYLYSDLFFHPWADPSHENRIRQIYDNWNPANLDWKAWAAALSTVKAIYVANEYFDTALKRVEKRFVIEKIISCENGNVLQVNNAMISNDSQKNHD
jgi:hypothetical protein